MHPLSCDPLCGNLCPFSLCASTNKFWFSLFTAWKGSSTVFFSCFTAIFNSLSSKFSTDCVNAEGCEEGAVTMSLIPLRFDYNGNSPPLCVIRSPRRAKGQRLLGFPCRSKLYFKKPNACSTFQSQLIWSEKTYNCPFFCHRLDFLFSSWETKPRWGAQL